MAEVAGVLEMKSHTHLLRWLYDARFRFQRYEESRRQNAIQERFEQGRKRGLEQGRILLLQQMLGLPQFTEDECAARDATQSAELEEQLQRQLNSR
jgi:hypothetical protein